MEVCHKCHFLRGCEFVISSKCFFLISKVYSIKRQDATKYTGGIQGL